MVDFLHDTRRGRNSKARSPNEESNDVLVCYVAKVVGPTLLHEEAECHSVEACASELLGGQNAALWLNLSGL